MKRRDEVLVGIVVTVALVMGFLGALWLARGGLAPGYPMYAKFPWGAGLRQGQPVLLAGVTVGYVDDVDIREDGFLLVAIRVRKQYKVPKTATAKIEANGFFGDMLVALYPEKPTKEYYVSGDTIPAGIPTPTISDVLSRVDTLARNLTAISSAFKKEMVDEKGLKELRATVVRANSMFASIESLAKEQSAEFTKTQVALRRAATAIDSARIDSTLKSFQSAGTAVKELTTSMKQTTTHLDSVLTGVTTGNGSFAKLLKDPAMYDALLKATRTLDSLMTEFQKNPRKFIKLSIF